MVASSTTGPVIAVVGATGTQGGSVIEHLIRSDKPYQIRALTRDASKPAAKALEQKGVAVVQGDIGNSADLDRAFAGADIVFAVTDFWSTMSKDKEIADGKRIVDAVKKADVGLFVWSGLDNVTEGSGGKITGVEHFDSKARVTAYAKESGLNTVVVLAGCYMSNFLPPNHMAPRKLADGRVVIQMPVPGSTAMPMLDTAADYGAYVREALEGASFAGQPGKEVHAASEELTIDQIVKDFNEVTGANATYEQIPAKDFVARFGDHTKVGEELTDMLIWFEKFGYYGGKDIGPSQKDLAVPVTTWKQFVQQQKWDGIV